jgi:tetratricopeptide (TPR) repeat protein
VVRISRNAGLARCTYRLGACLELGPCITLRSIAGASAGVTWSLIEVNRGTDRALRRLPITPCPLRRWGTDRAPRHLSITFYLSSIALAVLVGNTLRYCLCARYRRLALCVGVFVVLLLAWLSWEQCRVWKSSALLWSSVLERGGAAIPLAQSNLGASLFAGGRIDEALSHYSAAIRLDSRWATPRTNYGLALVQRNDLDDAIVCCRAAVDLDPGTAETHYNLGIALAKRSGFFRNESDNAFPEFEQVPSSVDLAEEAVSHFQAALRLVPNDFLARRALGHLLLGLRRVDEAAEQFLWMLRVRPGDSAGRDGLADVRGREPRNGMYAGFGDDHH